MQDFVQVKEAAEAWTQHSSGLMWLCLFLCDQFDAEKLQDTISQPRHIVISLEWLAVSSVFILLQYAYLCSLASG